MIPWPWALLAALVGLGIGWMLGAFTGYAAGSHAVTDALDKVLAEWRAACSK